MSHEREADVAIVGGGPVGLYLGLALVAAGLRPRVYERHLSFRGRGSRSIGIHPPSIELFEEIGVADAILARARRVRVGQAFGDRGALGEVSFARCPGPHRFVATLEQWETEAVLRDALRARAPEALVPGCEVAYVSCAKGRAALAVRSGDGTFVDASFSAIVGADGKHGVVRRSLDVPLDGATYAGEYAMADAPDDTQLGDAAAVFLSHAGLVESFPLPDRKRRWVVRRSDDPSDQSSRETLATRHEIARLVGERTRHPLAPGLLTSPTTFRAEHRLARTLAVGRVALVGDAAHIVSPIGGQGMNLGWLGARSVARVLGRELREGRDPSAALARDAAERRAIAKTAMRRAELNMWLGRPTTRPRLRDAMVSTLLSPPTSHLIARVFTMRALDLGV